MAEKFNLGKSSDMKKLTKKIEAEGLKRGKEMAKQGKHKMPCPECNKEVNVVVGDNVCPHCNFGFSLKPNF